MDRLACVNTPYLALQIVLKNHPQWQDVPVVVVDEHKPLGFILEVNRHARAKRILPGMRFSAGLSLDGALRAAVVDVNDLQETHDLLVEVMANFSPSFEPSDTEAGVFWLRVSGLDRLFGSFEIWSERLRDEMRSYGFHTAVVIGFRRFHTYAVARAMRAGTRIFDTLDDEDAWGRRVPLTRLGLSAKVRDGLAKLGITDLGGFLDLPSSGIRERFGDEAYALRQKASGQHVLPVQPVMIDSPVCRRVELDEAECDANRLLFLVKRELHPLLLELATRHDDLKALRLQLHLEDGDVHEHMIQPATPSLDEARILELVRLRLENLLFPSGVSALSIHAVGIRKVREQTRLFRDARRRRDWDAANHALARIRAEFGDASVRRLALEDAHFPEARFSLTPMLAMERPHPEAPGKRTLIRRIRDRPEPLHRFHDMPLSGWSVRGLDPGPIVKSHGPFSLSGGWWSDLPNARDYYIAETRRGDIFWVYFDHRREQWFLHGSVE